MTGGAEYLYFSVRLLSWLMKLGQQQKNDTMVILLTCGAVDILWAC